MISVEMKFKCIATAPVIAYSACSSSWTSIFHSPHPFYHLTCHWFFSVGPHCWSQFRTFNLSLSLTMLMATHWFYGLHPIFLATQNTVMIRRQGKPPSLSPPSFFFAPLQPLEFTFLCPGNLAVCHIYTVFTCTTQLRGQSSQQLEFLSPMHLQNSFFFPSRTNSRTIFLVKQTPVCPHPYPCLSKHSCSLEYETTLEVIFMFCC